MKINKFLFSALFIIIINCIPINSFSQCQFQKTNGPGGGSIKCMAANGSNIFAGTNGGGVFLSTNNGASWSPVNTGLTTLFINVIAITGSNIFVGTANGAFQLSVLEYPKFKHLDVLKKHHYI